MTVKTVTKGTNVGGCVRCSHLHTPSSGKVCYCACHDEETPARDPRDYPINPDDYAPTRITWKSESGMGNPTPSRYEQPCMIDEFFEAERTKPPQLRTKFCMITCNCPKHGIMG